MNKNELNLEEVIKKYSNYIKKIIYSKGNFSEEDIEEIISDVFVALWNNQDKIDYSRNLSAYIAGITKNLINKKFRKIKIEENIEDYEEKLIQAERIEIYSKEQEKNEILKQELLKMNDEEKQIFIMFYYEELKIKQIATKLNITESKVKMKLSRTRKKLKKRLGGI